jgi:hypothetical protein
VLVIVGKEEQAHCSMHIALLLNFRTKIYVTSGCNQKVAVSWRGLSNFALSVRHSISFDAQPLQKLLREKMNEWQTTLAELKYVYVQNVAWQLHAISDRHT